MQHKLLLSVQEKIWLEETHDLLPCFPFVGLDCYEQMHLQILAPGLLALALAP